MEEDKAILLKLLQELGVKLHATFVVPPDLSDTLESIRQYILNTNVKQHG